MRRASWIAGGLALAAALACSREQPAAPVPHSIQGHVVLVGFEVDDASHVTGTKVVGDADGVPVELLFGANVVRRDTTVDGVYRFEGLAPGAYVARANVIGLIHDETRPLTIVAGDIAAGDTLRLESEGDLLPAPNPGSGNTSVYFALTDSQDVEVKVLELSGVLVRRLLAHRLGPGLNEVYWDGRDRHNRIAPGPLYWLTLESGDDRRAQLLFRIPTIP
jgi:hypothetical protein